MQAPTFAPVLLAKDPASMDQPSPDGGMEMGFLHLLLSALLSAQGGVGMFQEGQEMLVQGWEVEPGEPALGKVLLLGFRQAGGPPPRGIAFHCPEQYPVPPDGEMSKDSPQPGLTLQPAEGEVGEGESPPSRRWVSQAVKGESGAISSPLTRRSPEEPSGPQQRADLPGTDTEPAAGDERPSGPAAVRLQGVASSLTRVLPADSPSHETGGSMGGRQWCEPGSARGGPHQGMAEGSPVEGSSHFSSAASPTITDPHAVQRGGEWARGDSSAPLERPQGMTAFRPGSPSGPATVHSMSLTLETEHLGRVHMRVRVKGEEVGTLLLTEGLHQKRVLEAGAHHLHQDLQQHGLLLRQMEVQVGGGGPGGDTGPFSAGYLSCPHGDGRDDPSSPEGEGEDDVGGPPQPDPDGGRIHVVI